MRNGVYGFRPESSEEEESEEEPPPRPPGGLPTPRPFALQLRAGDNAWANPQSLAIRPIGASASGGVAQRQQATAAQQLRCAAHGRLRFANCLEDDGEGKMVCRFGME